MMRKLTVLVIADWVVSIGDNEAFVLAIIVHVDLFKNCNLLLFLHIFFERFMFNMAIIIFGDSWIEHLRREVKIHQSDDRLFNQDTVWYGKPGLTCNKISYSMINEVTERKPDVVVLHVGGNDMSQLHLPTIVATNILSIRQRLLELGAKRVIVTEIPPRELRCWHRTRIEYSDAERERHTASRTKTNSILKERLGLDYLSLKRVQLPKHYGPDGVHLSAAGNRIFFFAIRDKLKFDFS